MDDMNPATEGETCIAIRKNGKRCQSRFALRDGLCPVHGGRVDPSAAVKARHERERERREAMKRDVERARLAPRDRLRLDLAARWDEVQRVLLDGALADGDRATLLRLLDQAFGKPGENAAPDAAAPQPTLDELVAALDAITGLDSGTPLVPEGEHPRMDAGLEALIPS